MYWIRESLQSTELKVFRWSFDAKYGCNRRCICLHNTYYRQFGSQLNPGATALPRIARSYKTLTRVIRHTQRRDPLGRRRRVSEGSFTPARIRRRAQCVQDLGHRIGTRLCAVDRCVHQPYAYRHKCPCPTPDPKAVPDSRPGPVFP